MEISEITKGQIVEITWEGASQAGKVLRVNKKSVTVTVGRTPSGYACYAYFAPENIRQTTKTEW